LDFNNDGTLLVSAGADNNIKIWEMASRKIKRSWRGHTDTISQVVFAPGGKFVASGSYDCTARIWDVVNGKEMIKLGQPHQGWVLSVAISKDGKALAYGGADFAVNVFDIGVK
jgi:WD40 repeat protein